MRLNKAAMISLWALWLIAPVWAQSENNVKLPETLAGQRVAAYIKAFNSGSDAAMREFNATHMAQSSLARLSSDERIRRYRQMYSNLGNLELRRVLETGKNILAVVVQTKNEGLMELRFEFEPEPPHGIVMLRVQSAEPPDDRPDAKKVKAPDAPDKMTDADIVATLDKYLNDLTSQDEFSGAVLLAKNGKPIFQKAYGLASKPHNVANRLDTKFNIGSINKIFTKIAIGQLAEQGKLAFDDPIIKHLPDYPNRAAAEKVTIRHLLDMTSGIGDFFNEKFASTPKNRFRKIQDYLPMFAHEPLAFEPGAKRQYSNGGFIVLGAIIERVSGQDYYDYVREHVFRRAGMINTDSYELDVPVPNVATGYTRRDGDSRTDGPRRSNIYMLPARGSSAGGGYSTVEDLLRFTRALQDNKILTPEYSRWILTGEWPVQPTGGDTDKAGRRPDGAGGGGLGIAGGAPGLNAVVEMDIASGYTAIVMANYDPPIAQTIGKQIRLWLARAKN